MLRFFASLALLLCLLYTAYFYSLRLFPDRFLSSEQQLQRFQERVLSKEIDASGTKILILGDSTAMNGFKADQIPGALSLAIPGASAVEIAHTFRRYLETYPPPRCLIIGYAYNWQHSREDKFWQLHVRGRFFSVAELIDIYRESIQYGDFPSTHYGFYSYLANIFLYRGYLRGMDFGALQKNLLSGENEEVNRSFYRYVEQGRGNFARMKNVTYKTPNGDFIDGTQAYLFEPFQPKPLIDHYLKEIAERASGLGIESYYFQLPYSYLLINPELDRFFRLSSDHLTKLFSPFDVKLNPVIFFPSPWMINATHVSHEGAIEFTRHVRARINCG